MAKKVTDAVKLRIPAGVVTPAPPVGPVLGQAEINIVGFTRDFNARTADQKGTIIPVAIMVYEDRLFELTTKTPPAVVPLRKAAKVDKGSGEPNTKKVARVTKDQVKEIAKTKMKDLNTADIEAAMCMTEGIARSMGSTVEDQRFQERWIVNQDQRIKVGEFEKTRLTTFSGGFLYDKAWKEMFRGS